MIQDATDDSNQIAITDSALPSAAAVVAFLRENENFFLDNPDILSTMTLPVAENGTISLAQRQTSLLRENNSTLSGRLQTLLANAQSNDVLFEKSRRLSLSLMRVESEFELNQSLASELKAAFDADHLNCFLKSDFDGNMGMLMWCKKLPLEHLYEGSQTNCVNLRASELDQLFPNRTGLNDGSAALIGLPNCNGLLALGSDQVERFSDEAGTLFIDYIGELIDVTIQRVVENRNQ